MRTLRRWQAWLIGAFWLPCVVCGRMHSGKEWEKAGFPAIHLKVDGYNRTGVCSQACADDWEHRLAQPGTVVGMDEFGNPWRETTTDGTVYREVWLADPERSGAYERRMTKRPA